MTNERRMQQLIQAIGSTLGGLLFKNTSGVAREVRRDGSIRPIRYGLGNISAQLNQRMKSSDLIGITTVQITPDMVGRTFGVFTAVEVKTPGWRYTGTGREVAQKFFIDKIREWGGIAGFATNPGDYSQLIKEFTDGIDNKTSN